MGDDKQTAEQTTSINYEAVPDKPAPDNPLSSFEVTEMGQPPDEPAQPPAQAAPADPAPAAPEAPAPAEETAPAPGEPAKQDAQAAPDGDKPPAEGQADGEPDAPTIEDLQKQIAELKADRERDRRRAAVPQPPPSAPAAAPLPEMPPIDYSDAPDFNDPKLYPNEEDAERGRQEYYTRKNREAWDALSAAQQQQIARQQAEAQQQRANAYMEQARHASGLSAQEWDSKFLDFLNVRSSVWNGEGPANPIAVTLLNKAAEAYEGRRAGGLPADGYETVGEFTAEMVKDPAFARAVADVVPHTEDGGMILGAVAAMPNKTRILRHLVTEEGQKTVQALAGRNLGARLHDPAVGGGVASHVYQTLLALDARLAAEPSRAEPPRQDAGRPSGAPSMPDAPRGGAAADAPRPEPMTQEWMDDIMERSRKEHGDGFVRI